MFRTTTSLRWHSLLGVRSTNYRQRVWSRKARRIEWNTLPVNHVCRWAAKVLEKCYLFIFNRKTSASEVILVSPKTTEELVKYVLVVLFLVLFLFYYFKKIFLGQTSNTLTNIMGKFQLSANLQIVIQLCPWKNRFIIFIVVVDSNTFFF